MNTLYACMIQDIPSNDILVFDDSSLQAGKVEKYMRKSKYRPFNGVIFLKSRKMITK